MSCPRVNCKNDQIFVLRKLLLLFVFTIAATAAKSQNYNYPKFGVGLTVGATYPYADLAKADNGYSGSLTGYYNLSPYIPIGLEIQGGQLSGGGRFVDPHTREYKNRYTAVLVHGDVYLGQIIEYSYSGFMRVIKDFYVGSGLGVIKNNMAYVQRVKLNSNPPYTFPGQDQSTDLMVPLRVGYEFKIYNGYGDQVFGVNIGYVHNITFGEGLDGYADPASNFKNNAPDQYRQIVVGIKFNFGPTGSFFKSIDR